MVLVDNLSSRIAAILLAGLAVLLALGAALMIWPTGSGAGGGVRFYQLPQPDEAVAMVEALEASPSSARPAVLKALDTGVIRASLDDAFPALLRRARPADARDPATPPMVGCWRAATGGSRCGAAGGCGTAPCPAEQPCACRCD
ncbi:hypothetical protein [Caulobacter sp. RL271]|uniref:Uncharacterized protein n=1 Tax=Caulobacter segnis TaxID=88688 RepID=A0ABY4ZS85_9CAUL|nr:hypothetical protein [Caulobacter segnis]USQ95365.1 hypothetical protein MZV50_22905 [Caulobacter segnis]